MILGNTLNGISIGLDSILESFATARQDIETRLSLGANRWDASRPELRRAVRAGMIPIINSMMIVGIVSLPGMMTGQLLSGTRPAEAIKYQITIMFLIASATAIGTVMSTIFACFRLLNSRHQLETWRVSPRL
jgi:putative ABC transport system permease protein